MTAQLALALGAPGGGLAMSGAVQGVMPPALRVAALVQIGVLAAIGLFLTGLRVAWSR